MDDVAEIPADIATITKQVKLVVWDLDETFWDGTLSEGGITPVQKHIDMVKELADRGIVSSICSKNDFETAKAELVKLGIWEYFVFPFIDWTPKGQAIKNMIAAMALRDENVLFLDDNHMNIQEAQFFNERIMCFDANNDLSPLMDLDQLKGKDDKKHSRLKQYKVLETKQTEQKADNLSNEDFLRQSEIKIKIITDIDQHMDRVLELLNRTNQLNFTKIRANTDQEKADLQALLDTSGMHAGLIHAQDRYGDYGIVGFFCVRTKFDGTIMHHFAFSCRTLNMGVEQWVWQYLGSPEFDAVGPVANPVKSFPNVDWITQVSSFDPDDDSTPDKRLCLVGGCDLLQVSFYCGKERDEFVNKQDDEGYLVRYDDAGFFLNNRNEMRHNRILKRLPAGSYEDMIALDESLKSSDVILLSMLFSVMADNLWTYGSQEDIRKYYYTAPIRTFKKLMRDHDKAMWYAKTMHLLRLEFEDRLELCRQCYQHAYDLKSPDSTLFLLSATTEYGQQAVRSYDKRAAFNEMTKAFCEGKDDVLFVDTNTLLAEEDFVDSDHYSRTGYFKVAEFINNN